MTQEQKIALINRARFAFRNSDTAGMLAGYDHKQIAYAAAIILTDHDMGYYVTKKKINDAKLVLDAFFMARKIQYDILTKKRIQ